MHCKWPVGDDRIVEVIVDPNFEGDLLAIARLHPVWIIDSDHNTPISERAWGVERSEDFYEICRLSPSTHDPGRDFIGHMPTVYSHYNWSNPRYEYVLARGTPLTDEIRAELEDSYGFTIVETKSDGFMAKVHPDRNFNVMDFTELPPIPAVVARQSKEAK